MPDTAAILGALRTHLRDAGLVRYASIAGPLPPAHIEPIGGSPAPGEAEPPGNDADLIISLYAGGELAVGEHDGYLLRTTIDVRYRGKTIQRILALDAAIVRELHDAGGGRRRGWAMGGVQLLESGVWTGLQPVDRSKGQGAEYVTKLYFEALR